MYTKNIILYVVILKVMSRTENVIDSEQTAPAELADDIIASTDSGVVD